MGGTRFRTIRNSLRAHVVNNQARPAAVNPRLDSVLLRSFASNDLCLFFLAVRCSQDKLVAVDPGASFYNVLTTRVLLNGSLRCAAF